VGLFGTAGSSTWRDAFVQAYTAANIQFFNPQKSNWVQEVDAPLEAQHLEQDKIVLFPVLSETYGGGSTTELGFAANAVKGTGRSLVIYLTPKVDEALTEANALAAKEANRARGLAAAHMSRLDSDNIYVVESLEQMLTLSITLYQSYKLKESASRYNPQNLHAS
jgi:hypothetical protein